MNLFMLTAIVKNLSVKIKQTKTEDTFLGIFCFFIDIFISTDKVYLVCDLQNEI